MKKDLLLLALVTCIILQLPAYAYLDPGSGSLILQVIVASCAVAGMWIKIQWRNIKEYFKNICTKK